jgi:putative protease
MNRIPELLIPAGNLSKLRVALAYGADAVYVGAAGFSMRPDSASFDLPTLEKAARMTHDAGKHIYVAINSLMFQNDLPMLDEWLVQTQDLPLDAVIVSDPGLFSVVRDKRPELRVHISTQMSTSNAISASFWKKLGAQRVILARECTLQDATEIAMTSDIEVEIFVHGAMCVAVSGRCLLSAHLCGKSGSRGECKHSCRWEWQLVEQKRPGESIPAFETGRETILLGSADLCLIEHIPQIVNAGVHSLKVEGRMKSEYYVASVTRVYREALDRYAADPANYKTDPAWLSELEAVSHRPYSTGFAFGYPDNSPYKLQAHNRHISTHQLVGYIERVESGQHELIVKNPFSVGDALEWIGPGMQGGILHVGEIMNERGRPVLKVEGGMRLFISFEEEVELPVNGILRRKVIQV